MAKFSFDAFCSGEYTGLPIDKFRELSLPVDDFDAERWDMLISCVDSGLLRFSCTRDEALKLLWFEEELPNDEEEEIYEVPCWQPDASANVIDDVSSWLEEKSELLRNSLTQGEKETEQSITAVVDEDSTGFMCKCGLTIPISECNYQVKNLVFPDVLLNRLAGFYSRDWSGYKYSGGNHKSLGWNEELDSLLESLGYEPEMFNHCLAQKYKKNGKIGFHSDDEACYPKGNEILTVSLGDGEFSIKCDKGKCTRRLTNTVWFSMPRGFQETHKHSVSCSEGRISLTFRSTSPHTRPPKDSSEVQVRKKSFRDNFDIISEELIEEDPLVGLNVGDVCPLRVTEVAKIDKPHLLDFGKRCDRVNLQSLQAAVNSSLPSHAFFDDTWHQHFVESGDLDIDFQNIRLRQCDVSCEKDLDKFYHPELHSGAGSRRIGTQKEALIAIRKRNADVPELADSVDLKSLSSQVADKFMSSFVCDLRPIVQVMEKMRAYHQKWGDRIDPLFVLNEHDLQRYEHMIKTDVKPTVTHSMHIERAVPATITFHGKSICANFSPWFTALFDEFQKSLDERFVIPCGPISTLEMDFDIRNKFFVEVDLSKFDKSQGMLHLEFQREILFKIGLPAHLVNWWCDFHYKSSISDPRAKVSFNCSFQRRTGDAFTYFGNTLVTMAMFCFCYDVNKFEKIIFAGDDSLAISSKKVEGEVDLFTNLFNMEAKIMDPGVPYICSKFLVSDEFGRCFSAPDPLREFQRLGKKKISADNEDALHEQFVGFRDRMSHLRNFSEHEIQQLKIFFNLKYKQDGEVIENYLGGCLFYSNNFKNFKELFNKFQSSSVDALNRMVRNKPLRLPSGL